MVACGIYMSRKSSGFYSPRVRLQVNGAWRALTSHYAEWVGVCFDWVAVAVCAVGNQWTVHLRGHLAFYGVVFSVVLILLRLVWVFPAVKVASLIDRKVLGHVDEDFSPREVFVVGWTGMRGVLALAAAMSVPEVMENGQPFGPRNLIVFLAFCVILVTLVVQGLTLPALIRGLGLAGTAGTDAEEGRRQGRS